MAAPIRQLLILVMALAGPAIGAVATKRQEATEYEFTPGPGMPSLESLGLTVEQLFNSTWVDELFQDTPENPAGQAGTRSRRMENNCDHDNAPVEAIRACGAFLHILGNHPCVGENRPVILAEVKPGDYFARVEGLSIQAGPTQSSCLHAGMAVYWVADNCIAGCDDSVLQAAQRMDGKTAISSSLCGGTTTEFSRSLCTSLDQVPFCGPVRIQPRKLETGFLGGTLA